MTNCPCCHAGTQIACSKECQQKLAEHVQHQHVKAAKATSARTHAVTGVLWQSLARLLMRQYLRYEKESCCICVAQWLCSQVGGRSGAGRHNRGGPKTELKAQTECKVSSEFSFGTTPVASPVPGTELAASRGAGAVLTEACAWSSLTTDVKHHLTSASSENSKDSQALRTNFLLRLYSRHMTTGLYFCTSRLLCSLNVPWTRWPKMLMWHAVRG